MCIDIFTRSMVDAVFPAVRLEPERDFCCPDRFPLSPLPHFPLPDLMEHFDEEADERCE